MSERVKAGQTGINGLDSACRNHDLAYLKTSDLKKRHEADRILAEKAWERVKSVDAKLGERIWALLVTNAMKAKVKMGMGMKMGKGQTESRTKKKTPKPKKQKKRKETVKGKKKKNKKTPTKGSGCAFSSILKKARDALKKLKPKTLEKAIQVAKLAIGKIKKKPGGVTLPRVISIRGGVLPLIPIMATLSALGSISGGMAAVAKTIQDVKNAKKTLEEAKRHHRALEGVKVGNGMFLKPYRRGQGLFLAPYPKN